MSITKYKFSDEGLTAEVVENNVVALHDKITGHKFGITEDDAYALAKHFGLIDGLVSVDDRLPEILCNEQSETVLAYNGRWWPARIENTGIGSRWFDTTDFDVLCKVTHWKPLPQPPKQ